MISECLNQVYIYIVYIYRALVSSALLVYHWNMEPTYHRYPIPGGLPLEVSSGIRIHYYDRITKKELLQCTVRTLSHISYPHDVLSSSNPPPHMSLWVTSTYHSADFLIIHGIAARVVPIQNGQFSYGTLPTTHTEICDECYSPEFELVGISSGSWYHCLPI